MSTSTAPLESTSTTTLPHSESSLTSSPSRLQSSGQIFSQTAFFNALIKTGYELSLRVNNNLDWKQYTYRFNPQSCALEAREDKDKPNSKLISMIGLRKFAISFSSDPLKFSIKTPNRIYHLRARDQPLRTLWIGWLNSVQNDSLVMAEYALRLTGHSDKPLTTSDKYRPPYWIPKEESDFCAFCCCTFKTFAGRHTCRDCGFIFCSSSSCYSEGNVMRCNSCVTSHQSVNPDGSIKTTFNKDGSAKTIASPIPLFNPGTSSRAHTYFQDLNQDPLIIREREMAQRRKEREERQKHQLIIDSQAGGLTTMDHQAGSTYIGKDAVGNREAIALMLGRNPDPKQRNVIQRNQAQQLYTIRETQRVEQIKKMSTQSAFIFGDLVIYGLILFALFYYLLGDNLKVIFDTIMKSL